MPIYTYLCLNTTCKRCEAPFVRLTTISNRDDQFCSLCEAPVVRDGVEEIGGFWIDKAYRPAFRTSDGKKHATPAAQARGLRWH